MLTMAVREARYDRATDWYVGFQRGWAAEARPFLPDDLSAQRVLDMACGLGDLSRVLADRGASVTAVDLSAKMLGHGRREETQRPRGIRYLVGDVTTSDWWDGEPFDGVVCSMALMDIDDLDAAMDTAAEVLRPRGWFNFSLLHPCFPGLRNGASEQLSSWPPERGYTAEGWWTTGGDGVRGRVGAHHRMLSSYLNAAVRAGFELEQFAEAAAHVPRFLIVGCRRRT
jgi:2-polyprenyl-3-methyl-5-hydroxy-6-metoxy-1,4-benzoquinol methylase